MTPHAWDAQQLAHGLREVAQEAAETLTHLRADEPRDDRHAADVWRRDSELTAWVNRWVAGTGSTSVLSWCEAQELVEWAEGEGHDGWPVEICEPPPIVAACGCGQKFSRQRWQSLRWVGVMPDGLGGGLSLRDCYCGSTISLACRVSNTVRAPRDMADEQRAAKGAEVES